MTDIQIEISSGISASTEMTLTFTNAESFVNPTNIRLATPVTAPNVSTLEHNRTVLDGSFQEFPDNPALYEWGFWSNVISGSDGAFAVRPAINANWGYVPQTSGGITLIPYDAGEDFARRVSVTWYNQAGGVISSGEYDLDADGVIENSVSNYYRVYIEFISTNIPRRRVRLRRISYGLMFLCRNDDISTCRPIEEAPESSDIAPSGAMDFSVVVKSVRMRSVLRSVKNGALLPMKLIRNGKRFGSFFIDQSEDAHGDGSKFDIHALSPIGAMDNTRFFGGMYTTKSVTQLVSEIMQTAFPRGEITANVQPSGISSVTGYMPICTCREALQQVAFANDKSIYVSRDGVINILPTRTSASAINRTIPLSEIYRESKITQTSQYTAVEVTGYVYQLNEARQITVVYAVLSAGDYSYEFEEPLGNLYLTGASFVTYGANHATIRVATSSTVYLRGTTYIKTGQTYRVNGLLSSAARENVCRFDSTLLWSLDAPTIALHLWSDVSRSVVHDDTITLEDTAAGDYVLTERTGAIAEGLRVERLDIDLRGNKAVMRTLTGRIEGTLQPAPEIPQPPVSEITFSATGSGQFGNIQTFTAPVSGTYIITADGASGAADASGKAPGGRGARVKMTMRLNAGDVLDIVVGQTGSVGAAIPGTLEYVGGGGGGYTAAFIRRPTGDFSRLGSRFDCLVMAAGGTGGGYDPYASSPRGGTDGDATTIYNPSSPDGPSSWTFDPNNTAPSVFYGYGNGIYQYIDYAAAGTKIYISSISLGGFGGGASAQVTNGALTIYPGGGGGWRNGSVGYPGGRSTTYGFSWCSETVIEGVSGYRSGNGQMKIEWTPG